MTGIFPVLANSQSVGSVTISQNGLLTVFDCTCTYHSDDVLRLAAVCGSQYIVLGVMLPASPSQSKADTPDGMFLHCKKSYSKNALISMGFIDTDLFHLIRTGDIYQFEPDLDGKPEQDAGIVLKEAESKAHSKPEPDTESEPEPESSAESESVQDAKLESLNSDEYASYPSPLTQEPPANIQNYDVSDTGNTGYSPILEENDKADNADNSVDPLTPDDTTPSDLSEKLMSTLLKMTATKDEPSVAHDVKPPDYLVTAEEQDAQSAPPFELEDGWFRTDNPAVLFEDPDIARACENVTGALISDQNDYLLLAVPIFPDAEFALMPVFCFGISRHISGSEYLVFKVKNGYLAL